MRNVVPIVLIAITVASAPGMARGQILLSDAGSNLNLYFYTDTGAWQSEPSTVGQNRDAEFDADGSYYYVDIHENRVFKDGAPLTDKSSANFALTLGPDDFIYAVNNTVSDATINRFDPNTGASLGQFASLPTTSEGRPFFFEIEFGPDGHLYAIERLSESLIRFDGTTGQLLGTVRENLDIVNANHSQTYFRFGPDGLVYLPITGEILALDPSIDPHAGGASLQIVRSIGGGVLDYPSDIAFREDGMMYVTLDNPAGGFAQRVMRFNTTTGDFVDLFINRPGVNAASQISAANEIPEPSTWLMLVIGSVALLRWGRGCR